MSSRRRHPAAPSEPMVTLLDEDGATIVELAGEIDLASRDELREAFERAVASASAVLVDLCGCRFIDSTGVGEVLRGQRLAGDREASFALACLPEGPVARVLDLLFEGHLTVHPSRQAALLALRDGDGGGMPGPGA